MDNNTCVGSMGLHQNNLVMHADDNVVISDSLKSHRSTSAYPIFSWEVNSRSVIDVFRGIRDKYFGKPVLPKRSERKSSIKSLAESENEGNVCSIDSLPVYCKLMILSLLDTKDVCNVALANRQWREVANDQILWRELLIRDMCKWNSMTNKSHPLISSVWDNDRFSRIGYGVDISDLVPVDSTMLNALPALEIKSPARARHCRGVNYKALYIHSSFQRVQDDTEEPCQNSGFPGLFKSIWQGNESIEQGEIIITGPGIDSPRTSAIFRSLMWGNQFLETKGLLPGNRDGIGSGVQVVFKGKISFNLIALYSGNNRIRETRVGMERLRISNVVELVQNDVEERATVNHDEDGESLPVFALHEAVQFYFGERKGNYKLIYAVDASVGQKWEDIACNKLELNAILDGTIPNDNLSAALPNDNASANIPEENTPTDSNGNLKINSKRPLLVLSCVKDDTTERLSTLQVIAMLGLPDITNRQWRVQDVVVSTMQGVEKGLEWLLRQS